MSRICARDRLFEGSEFAFRLSGISADREAVYCSVGWLVSRLSVAHNAPAQEVGIGVTRSQNCAHMRWNDCELTCPKLSTRLHLKMFQVK